MIRAAALPGHGGGVHSLYMGWVSHQRRSAIANGFRYPIFYSWLDLDHLRSAFSVHPWWRYERWAPMAFKRRDYLGAGGGKELKTAVLDVAEARLGRRPDGRVGMLTLLRTWGYAFNPVTFYYCYDADELTVACVVAEITNTPWGERFRYVAVADPNKIGAAHGSFPKQFHVSPFQPMDHHYRWRFSAPDRSLAIHMSNLQAGRCVFTATLALRQRPWNARWLARMLLRFPHITAFAIIAIHWQAVRLWWKGARFHPHPPSPIRSHTDIEAA